MVATAAFLVSPPEQDRWIHRPNAHGIGALGDRRQRRIDKGGERNVIEADDTDVRGDASTASAQRAQRADRHQVVVGEDRRRRRGVVQRLECCGHAAADDRLAPRLA